MSDTTHQGRWVIKIGSAMITDNGRGLDHALINQWVEQMAALHQQGKALLLVSSGAVAEGLRRLQIERRPQALYALQAAAAVGQMGLVQAYESAFQRHGIRTAQVLLTHDDAADRKRYLNVRTALRTLLDWKVIPVINENDTVAFDEIRFGDNDTIGALIANLVEADHLIILTDQRGMFDRDPRQYPDARLIQQAQAGDPELELMSGAGGTFGQGGMLTKVRAAAKAARSGASTVIVWGREPEVLTRLAAGERLGTLLQPSQGPLAARKQWLAARLQAQGRLHLDAGAVQVLRHAGRSLLPVGVTRVEGAFNRGDLVICLADNGTEIARGLVNYNSVETARIVGKPSEQIQPLLGYVDEPELIHRDNLVLL
jgi:glutamate 5-kinase